MEKKATDLLSLSDRLWLYGIEGFLIGVLVFLLLAILGVL